MGAADSQPFAALPSPRPKSEHEQKPPSPQTQKREKGQLSLCLGFLFIYSMQNANASSWAPLQKQKGDLHLVEASMRINAASRLSWPVMLTADLPGVRAFEVVTDSAACIRKRVSRSGPLEGPGGHSRLGGL